jgi:hypothetical protein
LAELLPNRTLPELLFLETKWASLISYGMTSDLLQEVLPIDEPVNTFTIRRHVANVAERLERELGDEQFCFIQGCQNSWDQLPPPDGPLTVGIDGGYVRGQHKQGAFEVIAGKSILALSGTNSKNRSCRQDALAGFRPTMKSPSDVCLSCSRAKGCSKTSR